MSGPSTYQPQNAFLKWFEARLPIGGLIHSSFVVYPTPKNLNYWWTFGAILSFMLGVQIVTGIVLAMHYTPHVDMAFNSVEHIMRDVNYGWLLRYLHSNGASMFFVAVYIHMFRGLYYGSYKEPREVLWILGVIIYLLMMATGFLGYTLPWGQMSFWGATVITNFFSAIPLVGESIVTWLWGGYAVGNPTLQRFFSLHYLLPFVIAGVVVLHIWALHVAGQNNPTGIDPKSSQDTVPFTPLRDHEGRLHGGAVLPVVRLVRVLHAELSRPRRQLHPGQSGRDADAHRARMVLPAVLRDPARDPEQARGRASRCSARSWCSPSCRGSTPRGCKSATYRPLYRQFFWVFVLVCLGLGWLGSKPAEGGYVIAARILTAYYFIHFLIILPLLGLIETPKPLPNSISEAVLKKSKAGSRRRAARGGARRGGVARPAVAGFRRRGTTRRIRRATSGRSRAPSASSTRGSCSAASRSTRRSARPATGSTCCRSATSPIRAAPASRSAQAQTIAAEYKVQDGPNDAGRDVRARRAARRPFPAAVDLEERGAGAHALQRHGAARHVGAGQGAQL